MNGHLSGDSGKTIPMLVIGEGIAARKIAAAQLASIGVVSVGTAVGDNGEAATSAVPTGGVLLVGAAGANAGPDCYFAHVFGVVSDGKGKLWALRGDGDVDTDIEPMEWMKHVIPINGDKNLPPPPAGRTGHVIRGTAHGDALNNLYAEASAESIIIAARFEKNDPSLSTIVADHDGTEPSKTRRGPASSAVVVPYVYSAGQPLPSLNFEGSVGRAQVITPAGVAGDPDGASRVIQNAMRGGLGITTPGTYENDVRRTYDKSHETVAPVAAPKPESGRGGHFHEVTAAGALAVGNAADVIFSDGPACETHFIGTLKGHHETGGHVRTTAPFKVEGDKEHDGPLPFELPFFTRASELAIRTNVHIRFDRATKAWRLYGTSNSVPVPKGKTTTDDPGEGPPNIVIPPFQPPIVPDQPQQPGGPPFIPPEWLKDPEDPSGGGGGGTPTATTGGPFSPPGGLTANGQSIETPGSRGIAYSVQETGAPSVHGLALPCPQLTTGPGAPTYDPQQFAADQPGFAAAFDAAPRGLQVQYIATQNNAGDVVIPAGGYLADGNPRPVGTVIEATLPPDKDAYKPAADGGNLKLSAASSLTQARWRDRAIYDFIDGYPAQVSNATKMVDGFKNSSAGTTAARVLLTEGVDTSAVAGASASGLYTQEWQTLQSVGGPVSKTLVSDAFTPGNGFDHSLTGEGGGTDNLATITATNIRTGTQIRLRAPGAAITLNETDNILVAGGTTLAISGYSTVTLRYDGSKWVETGRSVH